MVLSHDNSIVVRNGRQPPVTPDRQPSMKLFTVMARQDIFRAETFAKTQVSRHETSQDIWD